MLDGVGVFLFYDSSSVWALITLGIHPPCTDASTDFRLNKPSDIISTLVSIYDSKDLFVKELQVMLAQRLLGVRDEEGVEREVNSIIHHTIWCHADRCKQRRNIEILKIRFGEAALQVCEVMLRDMTDSKRIDQHVQTQKPVRFFCILLSQASC